MYFGIRFAVPAMARTSAGWATLKQFLDSDCTQAEVLTGMAGYVVDMSYQRWGTRVVQHALAVSPSCWQQYLVSELQGHVCSLALHLHGNHVIQKILEVMPSSTLAAIHEELAPQAVKVAAHEYGCRIFQRVVEHEVPRALEWVLEAGAEQLSWDKFGHHVVEALLERGSEEVRGRMVQMVVAGVGGVLSSKDAGKAYACRVIERVLRVEVSARAVLIANIVEKVLCYRPRELQSFTSTDHGAALLSLAVDLAPSVDAKDVAEALVKRLESLAPARRQKRLTTSMRVHRASFAGVCV